MKPIRALTFDCYGTLIDWERGIVDAARPWLPESVADDALLTAFAEAESRIEQENPRLPYPEILERAQRELASRFGVPSTDADARAFGASVGDWPAFPDTVDALRRLKAHCRLIITSNVDRASFAKSNERLGVEFDAIVTAEDVGSYKPAPAHFKRAAEIVEDLGVAPHEWLHVAQSLYHDHQPAKGLGLTTAWIDRRGGAPGGATKSIDVDVSPDFVFPSMEAFADAMDSAHAG